MTHSMNQRHYLSCQRLAGTALFFLSDKTRLVLVLVSFVGLWGCGGNSSGNSSSAGAQVSGNWQFSLTAPQDNSFSGGLEGGFLLQDNGTVKGQVVYSLSVPNAGSSPPTIPCAGSAAVTGTVSGQSVTLTAVAASQTFALTGNLSADGSTMTGTYNTAATPNCGTAQTGLQWSAKLVRPLSGAVQGNIHATENTGDPAAEQDFVVTGFLTQGPNTGASKTAVTGTLNFQGYPCLDTASVSGQISGSSVVLQLIGQNGLVVGQIGTIPGSASGPTNAGGAVTFQSAAGGGYILQGNTGYGVSTKSCPSSGSAPQDSGYICLGVGTTTAACAQSLSLTPALITFPAQLVGSAPTSQSIKLTNMGASGATLNNIQLFPTGNNFSPSDFNGVPNFSEQDNCSSSAGSKFSLAPQQSCTITIFFSPQQSCPWIPAVSGATSQCPPFLPVRSSQVSVPPALAGSLQVQCPSCQAVTNDANPLFEIPITGLGVSAIQPSTPELDFGPEDASLNEVSLPQSVTFTNQGSSAVQILPAMATPPCGTPNFTVSLLRPSSPGTVPGIQVVTGSVNLASSKLQYICDVDPISLKPNFQIVSDGCSGTLLTPQQSCNLAIVYAPQPNESGGNLDYFLQLNTLQCTSTITSDCEIDSGRFPVELKSALPSPLRVSPGAGLDFGTWPSGQTSLPALTITLSNDNKIAMPQPIIFQAIALKGDYAETDNCGISLAPGSSCVMNITFTPKVTGFDPGSITITYNTTLSQVISLRGFGQ